MDRKSRCRYQNNLPAAHRVFLNYPCQKSYCRKIPARNNRYGRKIQAFWYLVFYIPLPEKIRPENPGKLLQIRPENSAASNCRYGWKTPASNYQIRPENSAVSNCKYGRKIPASNYQIWPRNSASSNYRNGRKIQGRNRMNAITAYTQGCSGAMVEYLLHNLKVEGSRPACAQILFRYTAGKFRWRKKLNSKFRPTC
jgi:hypothetical protein